ncbi:collagen-binding protein [Persicobacter psychrovividus]|uniref:Collagen-binding protein n=2 Tax=Persicobacter psychrovividus TaxID=387638 RepID=A0ABN6L5U6_9BACT|nr:collagen-binding protein [Persicobacter psychrovividus]
MVALGHLNIPTINMRRIIAGLWLLLFVCTAVMGQGQKYTLSGTIKDANTGEDLMMAYAVVVGQAGVGTTSNEYGFYALKLPTGTYDIQFSYIGYEPIVKTVKLTKNQSINIRLSPAVKQMEEVVISAEREDANVTQNNAGAVYLSPKSMKDLPTFGGETDIVKAIQTTAGVKPAGDGSAGYYVRGGGLDQNLVLLDEAPVYNPSHLLGFFSVFNSDALKGATMYKGATMPEYGGRTASVMDIRMKDGNNQNFSGSGGIGTIASRLTLEGPIVKDKGSFIISGRRTYVDMFLGLSDRFDGSSLYFYDLNMKANYQVSSKDRVFVSGYFGRDKFGFDDAMGIDWGNATGTLRWNHIFSGQLFSNTSLVFSDYQYGVSMGSGEESVGLESVIRDFNLKQDFSLNLHPNHDLKFGANVIQHTIQPGNVVAGAESGVNSTKAEEKYGYESAFYIQHEAKVGSKWQLNYGLRYSMFHQVGAGNQYTYDASGNVTSKKYFESGEVMAFHGGFEPRFMGTYLINDQSSLKMGLNRNYQYMHMLTNSTSSSPTDTWVMSSNNIKPQIADQISLGYFRNFSNNMYEFSTEVYYKEMQNVIDYKDGADVFHNEHLEGDLAYGDGKAYGIEFMFKKTQGRFTGWASYTLSRSLRQIDGINRGEWYASRQDRIHDFSLVGAYKLNDKFTVSGNYMFYTGDAVTFPTGRQIIDGKVVPVYSDRNSYRMPNYRRLDLSLTKIIKKTPKFESSWNISLYNTFGTENAYTISFRPSEDDPQVTEAVQVALFRWVPSFTYNFKF